MDTTAGKTTPRLIAMAVSLVGDADEVRKRMQWSDADFLLYCAGEKEPPWPELDRLIAMIIHEQGIIIAKNREARAQARKDHQQNEGS